MNGARFDVIVVGARCAGSAIAYRLARAGLSVAMLDAARLPSEQTTSTHLIQPPGIDELDMLGVADAVRERSPALRQIRLSFDEREVLLRYGPGRAAHCLRRETLDRLLQQAALDAGVELRDQSRVVELERSDDGRVRGVHIQRNGNTHEHLTGSLVIGADGRNSTVAKLVGAKEYLGYDAPRACYWAYWRRPDSWPQSQLANIYRGEDAYVVFPTDGELLLIASTPQVERAASWRSDHTSAYLASVRACPSISPHLGEGRPVSRVRGMLKTRYFFRASAGAGWALIGDAGHHKDFFVGLGISDALRDARELARTVTGDGGPDEMSLRAWWLQRDMLRMEMFRWAAELGRPQPVDALRRLTATHLAREPELADRLGQIIDGRLSPFELVPTERVVRWVAASMLRGDPRPLPPLLGVARRRAQAARDRRRSTRAVRRHRGGRKVTLPRR
jgi:flavin-dependent dehydrogenase